MAQMPLRIRSTLVAAACVAAVMLAPAATAGARSTTAGLRVVTPSITLDRGHSYVTRTVSIKTDPGAQCFGPPGGSGAAVKVPGPTALGIVSDAASAHHRLRPLSVTDQFGFGLAVCGFGGYQSSGGGFWYLKVNHVGAQVGGDQLKLHNGDDVLWYLALAFPAPPELGLTAPARAKPGVPFQVTVLSYADDGTATPVMGAEVPNAAASTDASGHALVTLATTTKLRSRHGGDIPSNTVQVCVSAKAGACSTRHGQTIIGTNQRDRIRGTRGWDVIQARGGNDRINVRHHGHDRVNCGAGFDRVRVDSHDKVAHNCEVVVHH